MVNAGLAVQYKPLHWYTPDGESHSLTPENVDEVGQMLMDECIRSVGARYEDSSITELPGRNDADYILPFKFKMAYGYPPIVVLKQIHCYKYQSCESDDWKETEAYAFCQALKSATISRLPGYEEAPWGWEKWPEENLVRLI